MYEMAHNCLWRERYGEVYGYACALQKQGIVQRARYSEAQQQEHAQRYACASKAIRNPCMHRLDEDRDLNETLERISYDSHLFRWLDRGPQLAAP